MKVKYKMYLLKRHSKVNLFLKVPILVWLDPLSFFEFSFILFVRYTVITPLSVTNRYPILLTHHISECDYTLPLV